MLLVYSAPIYAQEVIEYYGTDHLGSVRVVFDAAGTVISRADYLPFGEEVFAPTGSMPAQQFTGQARDGEAGQDYFHARMYQPRTGRFNAVDPVFIGTGDPQQWNRYGYARNNPVGLVDPTGMLVEGPGGYCAPEFRYCEDHDDPFSGGGDFGGEWIPFFPPPPSYQPPNPPPTDPENSDPESPGPTPPGPAPPGPTPPGPTPPGPTPPPLPGPGGTDWPTGNCGNNVRMAMPRGERRWRGNINDNGDPVAIEGKRRGGEAGKRYILDWIKDNPGASPERLRFLRGYAKVLGRAAGGAAGILLWLLWPDPLYAPTLDGPVAGCP